MQDPSSTGPVADVLWHPSPSQIATMRLTDYQRWLGSQRGLSFESYQALWQWSINDIDAFWRSIWDYFEVQADGSPEPPLASRAMPGARWFPNARLNYAEHVFRQATDQRPALIARDEVIAGREVSWDELRHLTGALAATMRAQGIRAGDRVASYLPNRVEAVAAFLACATIGAVWSSCSPDMGPTALRDRWTQIEPALLLATDSYRYNGKVHDRAEVVDQLLQDLPSVRCVIHVAGPLASERPVNWQTQLAWDEAVREVADLQFERLPFDHPLWIVYSSGTTGLPKAMVHGHGGILLTYFKTWAFQHDLRLGDRLLFLSSTGWIVWNLKLGGLLMGATLMLYDGNPAWPSPEALWRFIADKGVAVMGCGAAFLTGCMKQGLRPVDFAPLTQLRSINSTGSPLPEEAFRWVYDAIKPDLWLASVSGGTDVASGFVSAVPGAPVIAGEIQGRELGVAAYAFNEAGQAVVDEVGELVITQPMPSMPLYFWNDPSGERYQSSYFERYPGVWRHGDWIRFTTRGSSVIYGRSDSTINRFGIRMGSSEIYRVVEELPEVLDSLVIDLEYLGRPSALLLFVVLARDVQLDAALRDTITKQVRVKASARHAPDQIHAVGEIPRTLTGKKMEVPVRRLLLGAPLAKVASPDAMANPGSLQFFAALAKDIVH